MPYLVRLFSAELHEHICCSVHLLCRKPVEPRRIDEKPLTRSDVSAPPLQSSPGPERACPRCESLSTRRTPRISWAHTQWRTCLDCGHIWMSGSADPQWHVHLYGRSQVGHGVARSGTQPRSFPASSRTTLIKRHRGIIRRRDCGDLPEVPWVMRARDPAGEEREWVRTDRVGTRHRAAYRLCHVLRNVLAIVVSQDGGLRVVRWHNEAVTYWDQVATAPW
jgi:hypothetical protein